MTNTKTPACFKTSVTKLCTLKIRILFVISQNNEPTIRNFYILVVIAFSNSFVIFTVVKTHDRN